jgi:transposase
VIDAPSYKRRNVDERAINKLKDRRARSPSRYESETFMFCGTVDVASIRIWLRDPVP